MPSSGNGGGVLRGNAAARVAPYLQTALAAGDSVPTVGGAKQQVRLTEVYTEELARLRGQAQQDGYADGYAAGLAAAAEAIEAARGEAEQRVRVEQAQWQERVLSAINALGSASERLDARSAPALSSFTAKVTETAFTVAEALVGRELAVAVDPGRDAVARALALCPDDASIVVRLHPADRAVLSEEWLARLPETVTVVADDSVERAGAVAEGGTRRVDAQIGSALERVRAVLRP